jgi:UDP-N-acetyl-D-glucosamine dehydrogenase
MSQSPLQSVLGRIERREAVVGVVGLGYVGLPLVVELAEAGYGVVGFEVSEAVAAGVNRGESHIQDVPSARLAPHVEAGRVEATTDTARLAECDAVSICVPTPLNKIKDPDLSYVVTAAEAIAPHLRPGQIVVLESTTYPGTTDEVLRPLLEESGLTVGEDVFLCYSPERVDPGNAVWHTKNTPKVLGGATDACTTAGVALYETVFDAIVPVENARAAELVKVYENTFRMINIALANELAQACDKLDLDVWGVIEAAATKPFGFMKFTPGPGLGGHCIPLDPHYLSWKMRTLAYKTRMIELASEINAEMPAFVVRKVADALNDVAKPVKGSRVLVLGVAYKRDVDDLRESPALEIMRQLQEKGAEVSYHDPFCPVIADDGHTSLAGLPMSSVPLSPETLGAADAVVVVTDHSDVDWAAVRTHADLIVDTRGVLRGVEGPGRVVGISGDGVLADVAPPTPTAASA